MQQYFYQHKLRTLTKMISLLLFIDVHCFTRTSNSIFPRIKRSIRTATTAAFEVLPGFCLPETSPVSLFCQRRQKACDNFKNRVSKSSLLKLLDWRTSRSLSAINHASSVDILNSFLCYV